MNKNPPVGKRFKKGQSGNPQGAKLHNPALKAIRRMTQADIEELGSLILDGNLEKLIAIKDDKNASVIKVLIASVAVKAINKGDHSAMNAILDRIVGRVKEKVEVTGKDDDALSFVVKIIDAKGD